MSQLEQSASTQKDFFKEQALVIQSRMAFRPTEKENLRYPLRYLLKNSSTAKSFPLSKNEEEISKVVREFHDGDGASLVRELWNVIEGKRDHEPKPIIITGQAGSGKTIFLGKLFARLSEQMEIDDGDNPRWLLYSQLKGIGNITNENDGKEGLFKSIKRGFPNEYLRESKVINNIESVCNYVGIEVGNRGIILIDSLDEIPETFGMKWQDLSAEMIEHGLIPIWTCRQYNFKKSKFKSQNNNQVDHRKISHLKNVYLQKDTEEQLGLTDSEKEWINFSIRTNPLVLHHQTNFTLAEEYRNELHLEVLKSARDCLRDISNAGIENCKITNISSKNPENFRREMYSNKYREPILYDILSEQIVNFIVENMEVDGDSRQEMNELLFEIGNEMFYRYRVRKDIAIERINKSSFSKYPEIEEWFVHLGFIRKDIDGSFHFSHRAFAEYVYWEYFQKNNSQTSPAIEEFRSDLLFNWRSAKEITFQLNEFSKDKEIAQNYLLRTGCFMIFIPNVLEILKNTSAEHLSQPWEYCTRLANYPANRQKWLKRKISEEQKQSLQKQVGFPILLGGWPGTGKTYAGTEAILNQMARGEFETHKSLVVTLNPFLSSSIRADIKSRHADSIELGDIPIDEVMSNITCISINEIIQQYAPDLANMIDMNDLRAEFEKKPGLDDIYWRAALADFQQVMYTDEDASLLNERGYLQSRNRKLVDDQQALKWYEKIEKLQTRKIALPQACRLLSNRLRYYERSVSSDNKLEILYQEKNIPIDEVNSRRSDVLNKLIKKIDGGELPLFNSVLIDEVQDLNPHAIVMISFLSQYRDKAHNLIMVGDEHQTLNSEGFDWELFTGRVIYIANTILKEIPKEQGLQYNHHLNHLSDIGSPVKLVENHRNRSAIVDTFSTGVCWPNEDFKMEGIDEIIKPEIYENDPEGVVKVVQKNSSDEYTETIDSLLDVVRRNSGIAIVVTCDVIHRYLKDRVENVEWFTPFDIKGLERPTVVVLGGWMVSETGDFSNHFKHQNIDYDNPSEVIRQEINHMNNTMLVALSRAQEKMLILLPTEDVEFGKYKLRNRQLSPPSGIIERNDEIGNFFSNDESKDNEITIGIIVLMELFQYHDRSVFPDPEMRKMKVNILQRVNSILNMNDKENYKKSVLWKILHRAEQYNGNSQISPLLESLDIGLKSSKSGHSKWTEITEQIEDLIGNGSLERVFKEYGIFENCFQIYHHIESVAQEQLESISTIDLDSITIEQTKRAIRMLIDKVRSKLVQTLEYLGISIKLADLVQQMEFILLRLDDNIATDLEDQSRSNIIKNQHISLVRFVELFNTFQNWNPLNNQGLNNPMHKVATIVVHYLYNEISAQTGSRFSNLQRRDFSRFVENLSHSDNDLSIRACFYSMPSLVGSSLNEEINFYIKYLNIETKFHDDYFFAKSNQIIPGEIIAEFFHEKEHKEITNRIYNNCSLGHKIVIAERTLGDLEREKYNLLVERIATQIYNQLLLVNLDEKDYEPKDWQNNEISKKLTEVSHEKKIIYGEDGHHFNGKMAIGRGLDVIIQHLIQDPVEIDSGWIVDDSIKSLLETSADFDSKQKDIMSRFLGCNLLIMTELLLRDDSQKELKTTKSWLSKRSKKHNELLNLCLKKEVRELQFDDLFVRINSFISRRASDTTLNYRDIAPMLQWWSAINLIYSEENLSELERVASAYPGLSILEVDNSNHKKMMKSIKGLTTRQNYDIDCNSLEINRLQILLRNISKTNSLNPKWMRLGSSFWDHINSDFSFFKLTNGKWLDMAYDLRHGKRNEYDLVLSTNKDDLLQTVVRYSEIIYNFIEKLLFDGKKRVAIRMIRKELINKFKQRITDELKERLFEAYGDREENFHEEWDTLDHPHPYYNLVISPSGYFWAKDSDSLIKKHLVSMGFDIDIKLDTLFLVKDDIEVQPMQQIGYNLLKIRSSNLPELLE